MKSIRVSGAVLAGAILITSGARAGEAPPSYDRVEFSVTADTMVGTDILVAYLSRQMEGVSAAPMADQVSKSVTQAIKYIKQSPEVKVETTDYQTSPIYQEERIVGWRVRQSIRLESGNFAKLSGLLGDLQQNLNLDTIHYQVTPTRMKQAEEALTEQALRSFQQRADKVTRALGRTRYRIVSVRITSPGVPVLPAMMAARPMSAAEEGMAAPSLEPGERKVQISVTGTIELQTE